jgi:hypothetical protein
MLWFVVLVMGGVGGGAGGCDLLEERPARALAAAQDVCRQCFRHASLSRPASRRASNAAEAAEGHAGALAAGRPRRLGSTSKGTYCAQHSRWMVHRAALFAVLLLRSLQLNRAGLGLFVSTWPGLACCLFGVSWAGGCDVIMSDRPDPVLRPPVCQLLGTLLQREPLQQAAFLRDLPATCAQFDHACCKTWWVRIEAGASVCACNLNGRVLVHVWHVCGTAFASASA